MNNIQKLVEKFSENVDCAVITSDINRRYFTGMKSSAGVLAIFKEKSYLLIDFRYIEKAKKNAENCEVILLTKLKEQLNELFEKHNAKVVAVEAETMTIATLEKYKENHPEIEFDTSKKLSDAITKIRAIKTPDEIEKITKAQRIAENAFSAALEFIKVGVTEKEIALFLNNHMLSNGAEDISFDTIALCGKNTSLPHGVPSEETVKEGEFVLMDFGAVYEGYHSDMTRTICVGKPSEEMEKVYNTVLSAQLKALEGIKADVIGQDIDTLARDVIKENGYGDYFGHGLGHGVGMEIHENPSLSPLYNLPIKENVVVTVEPGIYLPEKFGVRIEDFVVVTEKGCNNLTKTEKNLICL